MMMILMSATT